MQPLPALCYFNSMKVRLIRFISLKINYCLTNFNSMKVRLIQHILPEKVQVCLNFNSMKVRLILIRYLKSSKNTIFQFHEGSINTGKKAQLELFDGDFNSMKVRLILSNYMQSLAKFYGFQFHEGSINTLARLRCARA